MPFGNGNGMGADADVGTGTLLGILAIGKGAGTGTGTTKLGAETGRVTGAGTVTGNGIGAGTIGTCTGAATTGGTGDGAVAVTPTMPMLPILILPILILPMFIFMFMFIPPPAPARETDEVEGILGTGVTETEAEFVAAPIPPPMMVCSGTTFGYFEPIPMSWRLNHSFLSFISLLSLERPMTVRCNSSIMVFFRLRLSRAEIRFCSSLSRRFRSLFSSDVSLALVGELQPCSELGSLSFMLSRRECSFNF
mmetsp:Transcript_14884/g.22303  ORF Transcript_14884/g.22303 Transcript_14884/m.22303 type:complete len:251 (-) Transcript_14884:94-846(-)